MSKLTVSISYLDSTRKLALSRYLARTSPVPRLNSQARPISYLDHGQKRGTGGGFDGGVDGESSRFRTSHKWGSRFGESGRARFDGEKQL